MTHNSRVFSIRSSSAALAGCLLAVLLNGLTCRLDAQSLFASASYSATPSAQGTYDYTIKLSNSSLSSVAIQTFWYGWEPGGGDYLISNPSSFQAPPGWAGVVTGGGPGDGYAIRFQSLSAPLAPGSSLTFHFTTADSPAALSGLSDYYPTIPIETSTVFSGHLSGARTSFLVQPVPEPSTLGLLIVGSVGLIIAAGRNRAAARPDAKV